MLCCEHRKQCDIIIIEMGIHYSSQCKSYEDDPKKSLKSISMKLLVFASYAQFGVDAGNEGFMGDRNGIRSSTHLSAETLLCGTAVLRTGIKPNSW